MLSYNKEGGSFTWKKRVGDDPTTRRFNAKSAGKIAGSVNSNGYIHIGIRINNQRYEFYCHRLVWFSETGTIPELDIDHINQSRVDNRFINIRMVSRSVNIRNSKLTSRNSSGVCGVHWNKRIKKYLSLAVGDIVGRSVHVGSFDNIEDAELAVKKFRREHGYTETHGRNYR